jgi:protein-S-isoprenylcysteine O-methyltransferase Ste14
VKIKGLDALRAQVPEVARNSGLVRVAIAILGVLVATSLFFLAADRWFVAWMPDGEIVVLALGFLLLSRFFSQRDRFQQKHGDRAYQVAFARYGIWGLGIVGASIAHLAYIAGPPIPAVWWRPWLQAAGYVCLITGLLLWLRALTSLGIDNLVMLYVYRPLRAPRPEAGLYTLLRHPMYAAAIDVGAGLALIHANWYALLVALLLPLFFLGWIRLVEERELLQRFPDYAEYRRRVPALLPRPRAVIRLWKLLLFG